MRKRIAVFFLSFVIMAVCGPMESVAFAAQSKSAPATQTEEEAPKVTVAKVKQFKASSSYKEVILTWKAEPKMKYTVTWKGGGKSGTLLNKGSAKTLRHKVAADVVYTYSIKAIDSNGNESEPVTVKGEAVRTMHIRITFKKGATLTSHSGGKYKVKFKKGQTVDATGFRGGRYIFPYKCNDGKTRTFFAKKIRIKNPKISQINTKKVYTKQEAEAFVNKSGVDSRTKHLIWVNTYTQREYIFSGKKANGNALRDHGLSLQGSHLHRLQQASTTLGARMAPYMEYHYGTFQSTSRFTEC